jgi:mannosyltransferase OCH1-like enzyme
MFIACHKKWLELNPEYEIRWYTDSQHMSFLRKFDLDVYNAYQTLQPSAFKADLWRLCILYQYGGIYIDSHTTPFISLNCIMKYTLDQKHNFISVLDCKESGSGIHNGFMISSPRHPFLKQCIDDIVKTVNTRSYTDDVLAVTGPLCLSRSIHKVIGNNKSFHIGYNYHMDFTFYLLRFEWGLFQYIFDKKVKTMSKKYNVLEYLNSKIVNKSKGYSYMWNNKLLYKHKLLS